MIVAELLGLDINDDEAIEELARESTKKWNDSLEEWIAAHPGDECLRDFLHKTPPTAEELRPLLRNFVRIAR